MGIAIGIFVVGAMVVALGGAVFTDVKVWGLLRESRAALRKLPPEKRRRIRIQTSISYAVVSAGAAVVLTAPFGVRKTLTYFVILPVVILAPIGIIAVGIRGFRGQRQSRRR
jgi:hypothetical protein